ncbi:MAG: alpha/beta fold hydrolase [Acidimicrobiales bacterium]
MKAPKTISIMPDKVSPEILSIYGEFLAEWSVPTAEVMVPTRYGVTHVTEAGPKDGPVIVLLHGMGFPAPLMWAILAPHLGVSHRLIAPDTIGDIGKSLLDSEAKAPRSGVDYSHWLDDVLKGLAIDDEKVAIVGTSYGAWIALHYCLNAPERVDRLALMSPLGIAPWSVLTKLMRRMTRLIVQLRKDPDAGVRWLFQDREDLREVIAPWMRLSMQCRAKLGPPLPISRSKLRTITVPTLVAMGDNDPVLGPAGPLLRRARELPHARTEVLQGAGHALIVEVPEQMTGLLTAFL